MKTTTRRQGLSSTSARAPDAAAATPGRRWARLAAGVLVVLFFTFGVIPAWQRLGPVRELRDAIRSRDIDASALFYTDSDISCEAEASIRNAIKRSAYRADARHSRKATETPRPTAPGSSLESPR